MKKEYLKYDIAVLGGGPGGLSAALAAARRGAKVIIVDRNGYLGGNAASGLPLLGFLDSNGNKVIGGIAQEFIDSLVEIGGAYEHSRCPMHNSVTVIHPELFKIMVFEKCCKDGIDILLHCEIMDVNVENKRIKTVSIFGKGKQIDIEADVFIDATGDGDVAYMGGASYEKGQSETGIMQPPTVLFNLGNFDSEKFYRYLDEHPEDLVPSETMNVNGIYDTNFLRNNNSHVFLGLKSTLEKFSEEGINPLLRDTLIYINTPNERQITINSTRVLGFDGTSPNELTRGEIEGHLQAMEIFEFLKEHIPGFEDCFISSISPTIGIRETRRIKGNKTLKISDVINGLVSDDTIALGSYKVDIHSGSGDTTILKTVDKPYGIPLGALICYDIEGLILSGRCISMDAEALGSARVMPTCMAIGQAAGICAAIAVEEKILPSQVSTKKVVKILQENNAILTI